MLPSDSVICCLAPKRCKNLCYRSLFSTMLYYINWLVATFLLILILWKLWPIWKRYKETCFREVCEQWIPQRTDCVNGILTQITNNAKRLSCLVKTDSNITSRRSQNSLARQTDTCSCSEAKCVVEETKRAIAQAPKNRANESPSTKSFCALNKKRSSVLSNELSMPTDSCESLIKKSYHRNRWKGK